eukprot:4897326-Ditylum_brightwellii.AAC.1
MGKLTALHQKGAPPDPKHHLLKGKTTDTALTEVCMKLAAATLKLKKFKERTKWLRNSKLFKRVTSYSMTHSAQIQKLSLTHPQKRMLLQFGPASLAALLHTIMMQHGYKWRKKVSHM